jgi:hypothetical protein
MYMKNTHMNNVKYEYSVVVIENVLEVSYENNSEKIHKMIKWCKDNFGIDSFYNGDWMTEYNHQLGFKFVFNIKEQFTMFTLTWG